MIFILTALVFAFWKSELSEPCIKFYNDYSFLPLQRTVDYSDYLALLILPVAYKFERQGLNLKLIKLNPIFPIVLSSFAFMATSYSTVTNVEKTYHFNFGKDTLKKRFDKLEDLNYGYGIPLSKVNPDTVNLTIPSDYCFTNFKATIAVVEKGKESVDITLISTEHDCPSSKTDKEKLTKEFEIKIIDRLKNGL